MNDLKTLIRGDIGLAERLLNEVRCERAEQTELGSDLRDAVIQYVGKAQAQEASEEGESVLAWYDVLVDGIRGLAHYDDQELLEEFHGCLSWKSESNELHFILGSERALRLQGSTLWRKVCSDTAVRKEENGGLAEQA